MARSFHSSGPVDEAVSTERSVEVVLFRTKTVNHSVEVIVDVLDEAIFHVALFVLLEQQQHDIWSAYYPRLCAWWGHKYHRATRMFAGQVGK